MGCDQWVLDKIAEEERNKALIKAVETSTAIEGVRVKVEIKDDKYEKKVTRGRR